MSGFLHPFDRSLDRQQPFGRKAESLRWLRDNNFVIPPTYVLSADLHNHWRQTQQSLPAELADELTAKLDLSRSYAVRSSANLEDRDDFAFAGIYETVLNVQGVDALKEAICTVFDSANSDLAQSYFTQAGFSPQELQMSVVIQEMVEPIMSGVAFSRNPVTGFDEVVIEAVEGTGEQLVQGQVTPDRWIHKWGKWVVKPGSSQLMGAPLKDLLYKTKEIGRLYKAPVDIEWVFDGRQIIFVQVRPITTLAKLSIYSNRISREVMPGIILPLVWSVNVPLVNTAWIDLFTQLIGPNDLKPDDLTRAFHYRSYFNMGAIGRIFDALGMPEDALEVMIGLEGGDQRPSFRPSMKVIRHMPRMLLFGWRLLGYGRTIEQELPKYQHQYRELEQRTLPDSEGELMQLADELYQQTIGAAYLNIVGPLLATAHTAMFNNQLKKREIDPTQFDFRAETDLFEPFDPNSILAELNQTFKTLDAKDQQAIKNGDFAQLEQSTSSEPTAVFRRQLDLFYKRFGHMSDSGNDFTQIPWRENQQLVGQMIASFSPPPSTESLSWADITRPSRRLRRLFKRARQFQYHREAISSTYIHGYGLFRNIFLRLGRRLTDRGLLDQPDDIFYLRFDELRTIVAAGDQALPQQQIVTERQQEVERVTEAILPETIYGDDPPPIETVLADSSLASSIVLDGIPTSRGYYQGPACIIERASDFSKVENGDVIVIPYSDVSWTPLFAKAGAVVAESGGMLSHSSIVAREYGLPAVVSVNGACHILQEGESLTVDGFNGRVTRQSTNASEPAVRAD